MRKTAMAACNAIANDSERHIASQLLSECKMRVVHRNLADWRNNDDVAVAAVGVMWTAFIYAAQEAGVDARRITESFFEEVADGNTRA